MSIETIRVLRKAKHIPDGRTVYKKTGTKGYVLRKEVSVGGTKVQAEPGTILLCHSNGNAYACSDEIEFVVEWEQHDLYDFLEGRCWNEH